MSDDALDPADWRMDWGKWGSYPFVEDENANITGLGHQDKAEFAAAVNRFDTDQSGISYSEDEQWDADHIGHAWVVLDKDGERLWARIDGEPVTSATPGAIAVTTLWGQR